MANKYPNFGWALFTTDKMIYNAEAEDNPLGTDGWECEPTERGIRKYVQK
ncbi:hypothetical protein ES708_27136 [subsurface metagenome]